jgi:hypothetical protein
VTRANASDWSFLDTFRVPVRATAQGSKEAWSSVLAMCDAASRLAEREGKHCDQALALWEAALGDFGGDPSTRDWEQFRPLRLSREEDWSDWLAHLLQSSQSGVFASFLFDLGLATRTRYVRPTVLREEIVGDRRADLVVEWDERRATHVEVKIDDNQLDKTFETAELVHETRPGAEWTDFILLKSGALRSWEDTARSVGKAHVVQVKAITWQNVAIALRRSLMARADDVAWLAWAFAFCGAVEQRILGLPTIDRSQGRSLSYVATLIRRTAILREAAR